MTDTLLPLGLCLLSAIAVAGTNLFVKGSGDVLATRMILSLAMAASVLPFAPFTPMPTPELWGALVLSVVVHWGYQFTMVRALHRGDLSLVFPVMRGLAPLLTAITATVFLNETPSTLGWAGLIVATAALIVFAIPEDQPTSSRSLQRSALIWAALTGLGVSFYSVVDANGVRLAEQAMSFVVWLFLLDWIGITVSVLYVRRGRVWADLRPRLRSGAIAGLLGSISYGSALWAFTMSEAATVTALRETSVVFGAIFGSIFLHEPFGRRRIVAATILALGLVTIELSTF